MKETTLLPEIDYKDIIALNGLENQNQHCDAVPRDQHELVEILQEQEPEET